MIQAIFSVLINLLATLVQVIVWPLNQIINAALPDLSSAISQVTTTLGSVFDCLTWALGLLPSVCVVTLSFIMICEVAKHTIWVSTHAVSSVWSIIRKIKFW